MGRVDTGSLIGSLAGVALLVVLVVVLIRRERRGTPIFQPLVVTKRVEAVAKTAPAPAAVNDLELANANVDATPIASPADTPTPSSSRSNSKTEDELGRSVIAVISEASAEGSWSHV